MKIILVPTDFSSSARNATWYAAIFAREMKAKLLLFHSFQVPLPSPDKPVLSLTSAELEKKSEKVLEKTAAAIEKQHQIKTEVHAHAGFYPPEEILRMSKKLNPDLIVMGMKQKSRIAEVFSGSTVTTIIRNTKTPLIIVPETAKFIKPEKILLAFDSSSYSEPDVFLPLRNISKLFHSKIYVVNVGEKEKPLMKKGENYFKLDRSLTGIKKVYCIPESGNSANGVDAVLTKYKTEMVAMMPSVQSFIERIFGKNNMQDLTFNAHIPLLVLPDKYRNNGNKYLPNSGQGRVRKNALPKVAEQVFPFVV